ncbi:MAG: hypothetical protein LBM97_00935 [Candidatus Nomurabacteria bacterium]|jgi:hypothetical protein|nr:hypothetical protein [Candidatus Nomurabacteria bacterium]
MYGNRYQGVLDDLGLSDEEKRRIIEDDADASHGHRDFDVVMRDIEAGEALDSIYGDEETDNYADCSEDCSLCGMPCPNRRNLMRVGVSQNPQRPITTNLPKGERKMSIEYLEKKQKRLSDELPTKETRLIRFDDEIKDIRVKADGIEVEITEKKAEIAALTEKRKKASKADKEDLKDDIDIALGELRGLETRHEQTRRDIRDLDEKHERLEREISADKEAIDVLEVQIAAAKEAEENGESREPAIIVAARKAVFNATTPEMLKLRKEELKALLEEKAKEERPKNAIEKLKEELDNEGDPVTRKELAEKIAALEKASVVDGESKLTIWQKIGSLAKAIVTGVIITIVASILFETWLKVLVISAAILGAAAFVCYKFVTVDKAKKITVAVIGGLAGVVLLVAVIGAIMSPKSLFLGWAEKLAGDNKSVSSDVSETETVKNGGSADEAPVVGLKPSSVGLKVDNDYGYNSWGIGRKAEVTAMLHDNFGINGSIRCFNDKYDLQVNGESVALAIVFIPSGKTDEDIKGLLTGDGSISCYYVAEDGRNGSGKIVAK